MKDLVELTLEDKKLSVVIKEKKSELKGLYNKEKKLIGDSKAVELRIIEANERCKKRRIEIVSELKEAESNVFKEEIKLDKQTSELEQIMRDLLQCETIISGMVKEEKELEEEIEKKKKEGESIEKMNKTKKEQADIDIKKRKKKFDLEMEKKEQAFEKKKKKLDEELGEREGQISWTKEWMDEEKIKLIKAKTELEKIHGRQLTHIYIK